MSARWAALHAGAEELEGELVDPEDIPLCDVIDVAKRLDLAFDSGVAQQFVPLATGIDTREWVSGALVVTLHDRNDWVPDTVFTVNVEVVDLVPEDPEWVFVGGAAAIIEISSEMAPPLLQVASLAVFGARARVVGKWSQRADASEAQRLSVSIQLVGRRHRRPSYHVLPT